MQADECPQQAEKALSSLDKETWLRVAEEWLKLAPVSRGKTLSHRQSSVTESPSRNVSDARPRSRYSCCSAQTTRSRHADGIRKSHRRGVSDAAPTLTVSGVCSAAISLQRGAEALDQGRSGKRLAQEANCSGFQRPGADALIGEGRDENERRTVTLGAQKDEQIQTAHGRHLHIRNHARRVIQVGRPQELLGRRKCVDDVPVRPQKVVRRGTDGCASSMTEITESVDKTVLPDAGNKALAVAQRPVETWGRESRL
jgi:hypothetical protein